MKKQLLLAMLVFIVFVNLNWANTKGSIGVISPNGGETWYKGGVHNIKWFTQGSVGAVQIVLLKGTRIVKKIHAFQGSQKFKKNWSYQWTVPMNLQKGTDYKVQFLSKTVKRRLLAQSKENFSILGMTQLPEVRMEMPAILGVTSPNGGEKVLKSDPYAIMWTVNKSIGNPTIVIKKGGLPVETHAAVTPIGPFAGNKYKWTWNIGAGVAVGDNYRVTVVAEGGSPSDESDRDFSIVDKRIDVTIPRVGAEWPRRSRQIIRFRCTNITQNLRVRVKGYPGPVIAENVRTTDFEVTWPQAGIVGHVWLPATTHVIIVETMDGTVKGESHPVFIPE